MYSTCLYCGNSLGANGVVEAFPVGRRLAFDQARGRLWVVCRACEKWNLSPLEERWEAIETCERLYRDSPKRISTDQVGLARLTEGLELVRIGKPERLEFAAWRYGDQFGRRRRKARLLTYGGALTGLGLIVAGPLFGGAAIAAYSAWETSMWLGYALRRRRRILEVRDHDYGQLIVRGGDVKHSRLVPSDGPEGWGLELVSGRKDPVRLEGEAAGRAAMLVVPHLTPFGGSRRETQSAVDLIDGAGDPDRYLRWLVHHQRGRERELRTYGWDGADAGARAVTLEYQGLVTCLAVEMAVNEENERRVVHGELAILEEAWKEAEEVAAIADRLTLPEGFDDEMAELRRKRPD
jgi:hypothetical protein